MTDKRRFNTRGTVTDLILVASLALIATGVWGLLGPAWASLTVGGLLFGLVLLSLIRRGP